MSRPTEIDAHDDAVRAPHADLLGRRWNTPRIDEKCIREILGAAVGGHLAVVHGHHAPEGTDAVPTTAAVTDQHGEEVVPIQIMLAPCGPDRPANAPRLDGAEIQKRSRQARDPNAVDLGRFGSVEVPALMDHDTASSMRPLPRDGHLDRDVGASRDAPEVQRCPVRDECVRTSGELCRQDSLVEGPRRSPDREHARCDDHPVPGATTARGQRRAQPHTGQLPPSDQSMLTSRQITDDGIHIVHSKAPDDDRVGGKGANRTGPRPNSGSATDPGRPANQINGRTRNSPASWVLPLIRVDPRTRSMAEH